MGARGRTDWAAWAFRRLLRGQFQPWYLSMTLAIPPCAITALQIAGDKGLDRAAWTEIATGQWHHSRNP